jgi:hypothetical protein
LSESIHQINGASTPFIALEWNAWSSLGSGMNSVVEALVVHGNDLYAGVRCPAGELGPTLRQVEWQFLVPTSG